MISGTHGRPITSSVSPAPSNAPTTTELASYVLNPYHQIHPGPHIHPGINFII